jgi:IS30 family transposase
MDTVIGRVGGKAILTLMFPWCGLMLAFLRDQNDARSVIERFGWLWQVLGPQRFKTIFPLLLTDNGSEFSNPQALELDPDGAPRSRVFYCDPRATNQKSRIERNHEFLRMVLPKGSSFDSLTQETLDRVMSHINSYSRPSLEDKAPFDLFAFIYGAGTLESLGLRRVPANEITLKPTLLA